MVSRFKFFIFTIALAPIVLANWAEAQSRLTSTFQGKNLVCERLDNGNIWSGSEGKKGFKSDQKKLKKLKKQKLRASGKRRKKFAKKIKNIKKRRKHCRNVFNRPSDAKSILRAYCSSCHMGQHATWNELLTDDQWLAASAENGDRLISPGDPDNSPLVTRMIFYGASNSTMPLTNENQSDQMTAEQYETIREWIRSLNGSPYDPNQSCAEQSALLEPKLRRLSEKQIQNVLTDIFGNIFPSDIWPDLEDGARLIGMNIMADALNVNSINFERLYDMSRAATLRLISNHSEIASCASGSSASCVTDLFNQYALRLWRRPPSSLESSNLLAELSKFGNNTDRLEIMLNSIILSSNFLFRSEIGALTSGHRQLSNYEIASLLSFAIWNTAPDSVLLSAAAQPTPLTESQIRSQIERMLASSRARDAFVEMYKDYLKLDLLPSRDKDPALGLTSTVRNNLISSAEAMLGDNIDLMNTYMDVFGGNEFYVNQQTETFFNVDTSGNTLRPITIDNSQREGLLNHPAFLAVHSTRNASGIVKRGVFTLEQILCREIPDPPADVSGIEPPENLNPATTSERNLLQMTHSAQPACQGCHSAIDPAGFGYENFDAAGRYRLTEKQNVPIDASGTLDTVGAHVLQYTDSADYSRALRESPQMNSCVSLRFLEHYFGQVMDLNTCEVRKFQERLASGSQGVDDLIYNFALLESFSRRKQ